MRVSPLITKCNLTLFELSSFVTKLLNKNKQNFCLFLLSSALFLKWWNIDVYQNIGYISLDDQLWLQNKAENATFAFIIANGSVYDIPKTSNISDEVSATQVNIHFY